MSSFWRSRYFVAGALLLLIGTGPLLAVILLSKLETRRVPGEVRRSEMKDVKDFARSKSDLDVINPGPGEYAHVMEGQRHGYGNLTIGITYTAPGGAPPMHSHLGRRPTF